MHREFSSKAFLMSHKRALLIVNALARKGVADLESAREILREGGIDSQLFIFEHVRQIENAIDRHSQKADMIILGGGDGTLNAAIESTPMLQKPESFRAKAPRVKP